MPSPSTVLGYWNSVKGPRSLDERHAISPAPLSCALPRRRTNSGSFIAKIASPPDAAGWFADGVRFHAERDHAWAQRFTALCFGEGVGVPRDDAAAVEWLQKAAESGDPRIWQVALKWMDEGRLPAATQDERAKACRLAADRFRALMRRNIVRNGEPIVRFEGAERDRLLSIRDGAWSFDEIMALAESLQADIRSEIDACPLPAEPDLAAIDNLLRELQP